MGRRRGKRERTLSLATNKLDRNLEEEVSIYRCHHIQESSNPFGVLGFFFFNHHLETKAQTG